MSRGITFALVAAPLTAGALTLAAWWLQGGPPRGGPPRPPDGQVRAFALFMVVALSVQSVRLGSARAEVDRLTRVAAHADRAHRAVAAQLTRVRGALDPPEPARVDTPDGPRWVLVGSGWSVVGPDPSWPRLERVRRLLDTDPSSWYGGPKGGSDGQR